MVSVRRLWTDVHRRDPTAVELAGLFLLLFVLHLWVELVSLAYAPLATVLPTPLDSPFVLGAVLGWGVGFALAAVVYVRVAGLDVPLGLPAREHLSVAAGAVVVPALLVGTVTLLGHTLVDLPLAEVVRKSYGASVSLGFLVRVAALPVTLGALGYALVFHGAVQTTLRERVGPAYAVGLTTAVAGVYRAFDPPRLASLDAGSTAAFLVMVVVAVAVGFTLGLAVRAAATGSVRGTVERRYLPVVALGCLGLVGVATELTSLEAVVRWGLWVAAVGVGAYGYERAQSLWVPVASLGGYLLAVEVLVYLEFAWGLVPLA